MTTKENKQMNNKQQENRKNFGGPVAGMFYKKCITFFRHIPESMQVVPQAEQMQHSWKLPITELSDFNLYQISLPICMPEFRWVVVLHFKYLLPDKFNKIPAFCLKQKEGEKTEVADA